MKKLLTFIPLLLLFASTKIFAIDCGSLSTSFTAEVAPGAVYVVASATGDPAYFEWDFGDDSAAAYGSPVEHIYTVAGTYLITLTTVWISGTDTCIHTDTASYTVSAPGSLDCSTLSNAFTDVVVAGTASFTATSSISGYSVINSWNFGDGSAIGYGTTPSHTYATDGTYTVTLTTEWISGDDTCWHTATGTVSTAFPANLITGGIYLDHASPDSTDIFYVWLIKYDSTSGILSAVDSQYATWVGYYMQYKFVEVPSGDYRTKAVMMGEVAGTTGFMPTYDTGSVYWGDAIVIHHAAHTVDEETIDMQLGTVPSGPGFIGGSISAGAGKATDAGVANALVYLRDASNNILTYAITDATGAYSFSDIATGTYNVYPEALNYATTASPAVTLTTDAATSTGNNFRQSTTLYTIKPITTAVNNVTANSGVKIFPNPATGIVHILWSAVDNNKNISVTDITGRQLISTNVDNAAAQKDLDISALAKGVYIIHITSTNTDTTQKLVIE